MSAKKSQKEQSQKPNESDVQYDDELDEDFEEKLAENSTADELQSTLDSFEAPKGLESAKDSSLMDGPQIDMKDINNLKKKLGNMPKDQLMATLANILKNNNFGLGAKENLSKVSGDHRTDAAVRLREAIARKNFGRKSKFSRNLEMERHQSANKELHRVDGKDGQPDVDAELENLDEPSVPTNTVRPHVHSAACSHGHQHPNASTHVKSVSKIVQKDGSDKSDDKESEQQEQSVGKNAKRNKKRRDAAKKKASLNAQQ